MGSTPAARHAGRADASNAASPNANVAEASMTGSHGLTLNNCCVISLPAPIAAEMPIGKLWGRKLWGLDEMTPTLVG